MSYKIKTIHGKEFPSNPSMSILDSAIESGVVFEYGCKNGRCGVCKTSLLDGRVKELMPQVSLTQKEIQGGKILSCCCEPMSDVLIDSEDVSALHGIEIKNMPAKINSIKFRSCDVVEVNLRFPPATRLLFQPGQYIDVSVSSGVARSYSIASSPSEKNIKLLIKKVEGGELSRYWFERAKENDLVRVEGPKGTFFIRNVDVPLVFIATGTGIAPIISMLQGLEESKDFRQSNPIFLFWGNRRAEDFFWEPKFKMLEVSYHRISSYDSNQRKKKINYVQDIVLKIVKNIENYDIYACGSGKMIKIARDLFISSGLPENQFYSDVFVSSK